MIDRLRYFLALLNLIIIPPGLLFWFLIHPWTRYWRRLGLLRSYLLIGVVVVAFGVLLFQFRGPLLGPDRGANWNLVAIALVLYGVMTWVEFQYWKQLSIVTLVGIPELSPTGKGKLLREGIYGVVRHPRYLSAGIGLLANALVINYARLYVMMLLLVPVGYLMVLLEERELMERFGEEYRKYQREVPRLIPRWRKTIQNVAHPPETR
jgi:protein-S-isoprenylcysteine O-methyltransferase Ste14